MYMAYAQGLGLGRVALPPLSVAWSRHPALGRSHLVRELGTQRGFLRQEDRLQEMSQNLLQVSQGHVTGTVLAMQRGGDVSRRREAGTWCLQQLWSRRH